MLTEKSRVLQVLVVLLRPNCSSFLPDQMEVPIFIVLTVDERLIRHILLIFHYEYQKPEGGNSKVFDYQNFRISRKNRPGAL